MAIMPDVKSVNNINISNVPDTWQPPTKPIGGDEWKPPTKAIGEGAEPKASLMDTLKSANNAIFNPPEIVTKSADKLANKIDISDKEIPSGGVIDAIKAIPDVARNLYNEPLATMRGGLAGMTQGAANMLSPANIATTVIPEGKLATGVKYGIGSLQGINGINDLIHGKTSEGLGNIGFGALTMMGGRNKSSLAPKISEPINEPITKPVIRDYFIRNDQGELTLNPKYQKSKPTLTKLIKNEKGELIIPGTKSKSETIRLYKDPTRSRRWYTTDIEKGDPNNFIDYPLDYYYKHQNLLKEYASDKVFVGEYSELPINEEEIKRKSEGMQREEEIKKAPGGNVYNKPIFDLKYEKSKSDPKLDKLVTNKLVNQLKSEGIKELSAEDYATRYVKLFDEMKSEKPTLKKLFNDETGAIRFGPNKQKPVAQVREPQPEVIGKLVNALMEAEPKRDLQEKQYSIERAKRIAKAENVKTAGVKGFYEQLGHLKGELPKVDFERTKLNQSDVNDLINYVTNSNKLLPFEKIRAKMGLLKLLSSSKEELPQRSELNLLREVFGKDFDQVIEMHGGLGGPVSKKVISDIANTPKAIMASVDVSAPLRQGLPLIHKKEWREAIGPMFESLVSQKNYEALQDSIKDRPGYLVGKEAGLKLTDLGNFREEAYGSNIANMIPGVKPSERAFVAFMNKLRADTFDSLITSAKDAGIELYKDGKVSKNVTDIARFVNNATGRGDLAHIPVFGPELDKFLQRNAMELNTIFFSPRLIASRLAALNPNYYMQLEPFARKEALKSLLAVASSSVIANSLMAAMGAKVGMNMLSSDFAKSKFGNTRVDPNGSFQQYVVAAARLLTGEEQSSTTGKTYKLGGFNGPTRTSLIFGIGDKNRRSFMENKLSPIIGFADDLFSARPPDNNGAGGYLFKNSYNANTLNLIIPMVVNDMIDILRDDPNHLPAIAAGALGAGVQTYQPAKPKSAFRLSIH